MEDFEITSKQILNTQNDIKTRMNALFQLRTINNVPAIKVLEQVLLEEPSSDLLRHEVCYAMGQMTHSEPNRKEIETFLTHEVFNKPDKWASIVLHEAAEALGNIDNINNIKLLDKFSTYGDDIIKETCELSIENLKWNDLTEKGKTEFLVSVSDSDGENFNRVENNRVVYCTNDPAPPFNHIKETKYRDLEYLRKILFSKESTVFEKYRVLFTLRNIGSEEAIGLLSECFCDSFSPLLKHEVAFILGQIAESAYSALAVLERVLQDEKEDPIVRHETALALGEISKSKDLLFKYSKHENQLIAESCIVAEDLVDFWR